MDELTIIVTTYWETWPKEGVFLDIGEGDCTECYCLGKEQAKDLIQKLQVAVDANEKMDAAAKRDLGG